jgi:hypothetical protein
VGQEGASTIKTIVKTATAATDIKSAPTPTPTASESFNNIPVNTYDTPALYGHAAVRMAIGTKTVMIVHGGRMADESLFPAMMMLNYTTSTTQWTLFNLNGSRPAYRAYHSMVNAGDGSASVLFGGTDGVNAFNDVYVLFSNNSALSWIRLDAIACDPVEGCPAGRYGHGSAIVDTVCFKDESCTVRTRTFPGC